VMNLRVNFIIAAESEDGTRYPIFLGRAAAQHRPQTCH